MAAEKAGWPGLQLWARPPGTWDEFPGIRRILTSEGCSLMTSTPAAAGAPSGGVRTLHLSQLLRRPVTDRGGESLGRLADVIVRLRGPELPLVTGLVAAVGGRQVFVPLEQVSLLSGDVLTLASAKLDLRQFERRPGEVLLRADVLGHRLIDVAAARLTKAADLELEQRAGAWVVTGVDTFRRRRGLRGLAGLAPHEATAHPFREWSRFEPLIGHEGSVPHGGPLARIRGLKPAQIADLLEEASKEEEAEILGQVHADPELEADVFEELDEELATRLLGARTNAEIAQVLSRMRAGDAADAVAELPQSRRQPVLDLMPPEPRTKVLTLMGFNPGSAGGLMGVEYLAFGPAARVREALAAVGRSRSLQPEAMTTVHMVGENGRLQGVVTLVGLMQADPDATFADVCDTDPVRVGPDTDVEDVAVLMSDYNLITVPVVDDRRHLIGIITVDDVLEATVPEEWRRREAAQPPDSRAGNGP